MSRLPVLIVGAGPTGLMMACELARHGIPFRIIDRKPEPTQGSNATWIQTRTLEIFEAIGIVDNFLKKGHKCESINFYAQGKELSTISLKDINTDYPFILMLPQSKTEALLTERLLSSGACVERSLELIDIHQTKDNVVSKILLPGGEIENIKSHWVIACDGSNSTIREKCKMPFQGKNIPEQFMVADAVMNSSLPSDQIHVFCDKGTIFPDRGTIFSAFPWGSKNYRLTANLYMESPRQFFTEHEVKEVVAERTYGNYIVESVSWISPFWIQGKAVKQMRNNGVFLVGDAAHTHSPATGQGMNTGIQDAFNLAWKLALVVKGKAKPTLLESYHLERYPIIQELVRQTDSLTHMALFNKDFIKKLKSFNRKLASEPGYSKKISEDLTQLAIHYENSPIIDYHEHPVVKSPQPGERAPNAKLSQHETLFNYLNNIFHNILIFTDNSEDMSSQVQDLEAIIQKKYTDNVKVWCIVKDTKHKFNNVILDSKAAIYRQYHIKDSAIYIIRPDNYIAYASTQLDPGSIDKFLNNYFSPH